MMENKRYTTDNGSNEDVCLVDNVTGKEFESDFDEVVDLLNEQDEKISELEREKQILKDKAKILLDYYSRRYATALFNNARPSKQFRSDLWLVTEVLCNLGLWDDGGV